MPERPARLGGNRPHWPQEPDTCVNCRKPERSPAELMETPHACSCSRQSHTETKAGVHTCTRARAHTHTHKYTLREMSRSRLIGKGQRVKH